MNPFSDGKLKKVSIATLLWLAFRLLMPGGMARADPADASPPQNILAIYSDERLLPANLIVDENIRSILNDGQHGGIGYFTEFMDVTRFPQDAYRGQLRDFLSNKYQAHPPDLIIAVGKSALDFLIAYRKTLFASVPVVFCAVMEREIPWAQLDASMIGIPVAWHPERVLDLALQLQPDTQNVAVVLGSGQRDRDFLPALNEAAKGYEGRLTFSWLSNLSMEQLRLALSKLPPHSIVLYSTLFQDGGGKTYFPQKALDTFASASNAPIYGFFETYVGHGAVGGNMETFETLGKTVAQLGLRVLAGEDPQAVITGQAHASTTLLDWRQLRRWHIADERLPPDSVVRYREHSFWELYWHWAILAAALCAAEALLIALLLFHLRQRRLAETALQKSEARLNLAAESAGAGLWELDMQTQQFWATPKAMELFGFEPGSAILLEAVLNMIHPDDRASVRQSISQATASRQDNRVEYRVLLPDGGYRWLISLGRVQAGQPTTSLSMLGATIDISQRKQTEQAIAGQLRFETLLAEISTRFLKLPLEEVDLEIERSLSRVLDLLSVEACELIAVQAGESIARITHAAYGGGIEPTSRETNVAGLFPWHYQQVLGLGRPVKLSQLSELPAEAHRDRQSFLALGISSLLTVPVAGCGSSQHTGYLFSVQSRRGEHHCPPECLPKLQLLAELFVNALGRQTAEIRAEKLRDELAHAARVTTLGELSATLAHELNQPLGAILSNAEAAQIFLKQGPTAQEEVHTILEDIRQDGQRAGEVIHRIRTLLQGEKFHTQPIEIRSLLENACALVRSMLLSRRVKLQIDIERELPPVLGDTVQLQQVLLNLILNALDAMAERQPSERLLVIQAVRNAADNVSVSVRDTGTGIPQERLARVFEPFFTTKGDGMGMGLSICRTIIQAHGGRIHAENNPTQGVTVSFSLPLAGTAA